MTELGVIFDKKIEEYARGMEFKTRIQTLHFARFLMVLLFSAVSFLTEVAITHDLGHYFTHKTIRYFIAPTESLF